MSFSRKNPTKTDSWNKLSEHYKQLKDIHLFDMFAENPERETQMSTVFGDFFVDFSKNRWTSKTIELFSELSDELDEDTVIVGSYDEHESLRSSGVKSKYISNETVISIIKKADNYKNPQDYMTKSLNPMDILVDFADEWADNIGSDLADAYQEMLTKLENLI